jgi:hypothetical protein
MGSLLRNLVNNALSLGDRIALCIEYHNQIRLYLPIVSNNDTVSVKMISQKMESTLKKEINGGRGFKSLPARHEQTPPV